MGFFTGGGLFDILGMDLQGRHFEVAQELGRRFQKLPIREKRRRLEHGAWLVERNGTVGAWWFGCKQEHDL